MNGFLHTKSANNQDFVLVKSNDPRFKNPSYYQFIPESLIDIFEAAELKASLNNKSYIYIQIPIGLFKNIVDKISEYSLNKSISNKIARKREKHFLLMDKYFRDRDLKQEYFNKSTYHAKMAMIYGHNTGYVQKRLVINLERSHLINQAIQLCDIVLSEKFIFSQYGVGKKAEYQLRKIKLQEKINKANDSPNDILFNEDELQKVFYNNSYSDFK